ncbi:hypothetical protein C8J56DRAFT_199373 [Mycena floridula]|nr:hypothetical protein C8J56DRAFT_199373 [Mycena floridula]
MRRDLEGYLFSRELAKDEKWKSTGLSCTPFVVCPRRFCANLCVLRHEDLDDDGYNRANSLTASSTIWILPRVSADWRSITLSFPRMWFTLRLATKDFDTVQLPRTMRMLGVQIHRSGSHDLSLAIDSSVDLYRNHTPFPNTIFHLLSLETIIHLYNRQIAGIFCSIDHNALPHSCNSTHKDDGEEDHLSSSKCALVPRL